MATKLIKDGELPYLKFIDTRSITNDLKHRFEIYNYPIFEHNNGVYAGPFKTVSDAYKIKIKHSRCSNRIIEVVGMPRISVQK